MPAVKTDLSLGARVGYYLSNLILRGLILLAGLLPYRWRVPMMGWLAARVLAPLAGFHKRIRDNLALACPNLPEAEVARLCLAVPDNAGRTAMEYYSTRAYLARCAAADRAGPGFAAFEAAQKQGRAVIFVSGHFGNYDAVRGYLTSRGYAPGVLYRRMANPYFNDHYAAALAALGGPIFEQGRRGMAQMVRHLRAGGILGILNDVHAHGGKELRFFGQPAVTSTITAEMALKYDALLIPCYGVRLADGLSFRVEMHAPIRHSDALTMTQAINDDLEAMVRAHMGQWFWIHRRWKPWLNLGLQPASDE